MIRSQNEIYERLDEAFDKFKDPVEDAEYRRASQLLGLNLHLEKPISLRK